MKRTFNVIIERDTEGWFVGSVPELPGCHTQARSVEELMDRIREAIALCLDEDNAAEDGSEFIGVEQISLSA